jgi:energy-coupling factor transporter ATP-binding protein EcfA2
VQGSSLGLVNGSGIKAVLLTGVYGSGKSTVAKEMAYLLEQAGEPYALLDLDYLSWGGAGEDDRASEFALMLANLAAVAANYRRAGIPNFVLAYFVRTAAEVHAIEQALGASVKVVPLIADLPVIQQRLAGDVTTGRGDDMRAAAAAIVAGEGVGFEHVAISNNRPVTLVAREIMADAGWV